MNVYAFAQGWYARCRHIQANTDSPREGTKTVVPGEGQDRPRVLKCFASGWSDDLATMPSCRRVINIIIGLFGSPDAQTHTQTRAHRLIRISSSLSSCPSHAYTLKQEEDDRASGETSRRSLFRHHRRDGGKSTSNAQKKNNHRRVTLKIGRWSSWSQSGHHHRRVRHTR